MSARIQVNSLLRGEPLKIKLSVKSKVAVIFIAMGLLLACGVGVAVYSISYRQVAAQYSEMALSSAHMAAAIIDGDQIDSYLENGRDETYHNTCILLRELKRTHNLVYLYVFKPDDEFSSGVYVFDIFSEGNDPDLISQLGDPVAGVETDHDIIGQVYQKQSVAIVSDTDFGYLATAFVPVYASDGSVTAVAGVDIPMDIVLRDVRIQTFQIAGAILGIAALFLSLLLLTVQRRILNPIVRLSRHMEDFDSGDSKLQEFIVPHTGDELQSVAENFNRMVEEIRLYLDNLAAVTAERERIATELAVATQIQTSMLPCIFPPFPDRAEFDIFATMLPAKEVGGDFYDFFLIGENKLAVVIADVSGKGIPAALFMVIAKTLIKNNAQSGMSPKEVFETVNEMLCENNDAGMFVTAFMGYIDFNGGKFTYANAGHNYPLVKRLNGDYGFLKTAPSFILAGMEGTAYAQEEIRLSPGDVLYLYTDGVTEAVNTESEFFTDLRLLSVLNRHKGYPVKELLVAVKEEIDGFATGAEQADDITMLGLKMN